MIHLETRSGESAIFKMPGKANALLYFLLSLRDAQSLNCFR